MPVQSQTLAQQRAAIGRAVLAEKRHGSTAERAQRIREERAKYAEAKLSAYIERVVAEAPPLSPEQLDRLAVLLRGGAA